MLADPGVGVVTPPSPYNHHAVNHPSLHHQTHLLERTVSIFELDIQQIENIII